MFRPDPRDPFKDPAWRFRRASLLARSRGRATAGGDDPRTRACARFLRGRGRRGGGWRCDPALAEAIALYESGDPAWRRWEAEARLLAGEGDGAVAAACGLGAECVRWYHDLFFEVRPHLDAQVYITTVVLGPRLHSGLRADDAELLLKLLAYQRGPLVIGPLLRLLSGPPPAAPQRLDRLGDGALEELGGLLRLRLLVLTLTCPLEASTPGEAARLGAVFAAVRADRERAAAARDCGREALLPTAADALKAVGASAGQAPTSQPDAA
jgi:hypothetical protein